MGRRYAIYLTIFIPDRALGVNRGSVIQQPRVPLPSLQPIGGTISGSARPADAPPPTTTTPQAKYRPRPTHRTSSTLVPQTGKRKRTSSRLIYYSEDTEDNAGNRYGGDGTSSCESTPLEDHAQVKRPRISGITRSSTRSLGVDVDVQVASSPSLPAPDGIMSSSDVPGTGTSLPTDREGSSLIGATATAAPIPQADLHPPDPLVESVDKPLTNLEVPAVSPNEVDGLSHEAEAAPTTITEIIPVRPELTTRSTPIANAPITAATTPPPVLPCPIDAEKVPAFLLSHGTGGRRVNIFGYLNELEEPHFQQVLFHYIHFEFNDKSNVNGSLPTAGRPPEISRWTSRACPAYLPGCAEDEGTFHTFVDSIFDWWGSIQPSWRSFERGVVSREVRRDWEVLRAPRINGLLNVVILVYWLGRALEERWPEGSFRADYEFLADDIAWVFSHLPV